MAARGAGQIGGERNGAIGGHVAEVVDEDDHEHVAATERSPDLIRGFAATGVRHDVGHIGERVGRHDVCAASDSLTSPSAAAAKMSYGYLVTLTAPSELVGVIGPDPCRG